jgi:carbamoyltransferase
MLASEARLLFDDWDEGANPHMTTAYMVRRECRDRVSGVIGPDGSCRPQVVGAASEEPFAALLRAVRTRIGAGVVLNTSFNIHGEPLVCTPLEAVDVFLRSGADALALGPYLVVNERDAT